MPGVRTTSTSSKIPLTRAASLASPPRSAAIAGRRRATGSCHVARSLLEALRVRHRCDVIVDAAQVARCHVPPARIAVVIRGAVDHLVAELAQQRPRPRSRRLAPSLADPVTSHQAGSSRSPRSSADQDCGPLRRRNPPRCGSSVVVTSRKRAASSTVRVIGPFTISPDPVVVRAQGHTIALRLEPKRPHHVAGSSDRATSIGAHSERRRAQQRPRLRSHRCYRRGTVTGSHGLRVGPNVGDSVNGQIVISGTFVLPITIAPAARNRRTTSPSRSFSVRTPRYPKAVSSPATSMSSLIATATPRSGNRSPLSMRCWASSASRRALSAGTCGRR